MRISRIFIKLFVLAVILWSAMFYAGVLSRNYEIEKDKIERDNGGFGIYHAVEDLNYWDYTQLGLFILAGSSTVAAIWLRKFDE